MCEHTRQTIQNAALFLYAIGVPINANAILRHPISWDDGTTNNCCPGTVTQVVLEKTTNSKLYVTNHHHQFQHQPKIETKREMYDTNHHRLFDRSKLSHAPYNWGNILVT